MAQQTPLAKAETLVETSSKWIFGTCKQQIAHCLYFSEQDITASTARNLYYAANTSQAKAKTIDNNVHF